MLRAHFAEFVSNLPFDRIGRSRPRARRSSNRAGESGFGRRPPLRPSVHPASKQVLTQCMHE